MGPAGNQPVHRPLRHLRRDLNRARLVDLPRAVAQVVEGVGAPALLCVDGEGDGLGRILQLTTWAGASCWDVTRAPSCCTVGEGMRALTPILRRLPQAFAGLMGALVNEYLNACQAASRAGSYWGWWRKRCRG